MVEDDFPAGKKVKAVKPLIIAHRGSSALAPENTFAAFQRAIEDAADGIEFDVRLTKDNVPVIFHDATLKRIAKINDRISDLTFKELEKIDVGSWFNRAFPKISDENFSAETVPTLERSMKFLDEYRGLIYVELKDGNSTINKLAEAVCCQIRQSRLLPNIIVKSFNLEALEIVNRLLPEVRTAALFKPKIQTIIRKKKLILGETKRYRADEISMHYSLATKKFINLAKEKHLPVTIWTADNPAWVKRAVNLRINAIITNNPARLLAERKKILSEIGLPG